MLICISIKAIGLHLEFRSTSSVDCHRVAGFKPTDIIKLLMITFRAFNCVINIAAASQKVRFVRVSIAAFKLTREN